MSHTVLTKHALHVLNSTDSDHKSREVAVAAMVGAAELDVAPPGTSEALWNYLQTNPKGPRANEAAEVIGNKLSYNPSICFKATAVATTSETHPRLFECSLTVLTGTSFAGRVSVEALPGISECSARMGRRVIMMFPPLVEAVHEQSGGLPEGMLRALRDNWSRALLEDLRVESPEIARLLPRMDLDWLQMMLKDPSAQVRRAVALTIPRMADAHQALEVIEERIVVESVHDVLAALHAGIEEIILQIERDALRRRRRGES